MNARRQTKRPQTSKAPRPEPASVVPLWQHHIIPQRCQFCGADPGQIRLGVFVGDPPRFACTVCEDCLAKGSRWLKRECRSWAYCYQITANLFAGVGKAGLRIPTEEALVIATAELVARGARR